MTTKPTPATRRDDTTRPRWGHCPFHVSCQLQCPCLSLQCHILVLELGYVRSKYTRQSLPPRPWVPRKRENEKNKLEQRENGKNSLQWGGLNGPPSLESRPPLLQCLVLPASSQKPGASAGLTDDRPYSLTRKNKEEKTQPQFEKPHCLRIRPSCHG